MPKPNPQRAEAASLYASLAAEFGVSTWRPPEVSPDTLEVDPFDRVKAEDDADLWLHTLEHCQRAYAGGKGLANLIALEARLTQRRRALFHQLRSLRKMPRLNLPGSASAAEAGSADVGPRRRGKDERLPSAEAARQKAAFQTPVPYPEGQTRSGRDQAAQYKRLDIYGLEETLAEADAQRFGELTERLAGTLRVVNLRLSAVRYYLDRQVVLLDDSVVPPLEKIALAEAFDVSMRGEPIYVALVYYYLFKSNRPITSRADLIKAIDLDTGKRGVPFRIDDNRQITLPVVSGRGVVDAVVQRVGHKPNKPGPGGDKFDLFKRRVFETHREYLALGVYDDRLTR